MENEISRPPQKKNEKEKRKRKYALHLPFGRRIDDGRKMYSSPPEISNKMNFDDQKKRKKKPHRRRRRRSTGGRIEKMKKKEHSDENVEKSAKNGVVNNPELLGNLINDVGRRPRTRNQSNDEQKKKMIIINKQKKTSFVRVRTVRPRHRI